VRAPIIKTLRLIPSTENKSLRKFLKLAFIIILAEILIILFSLSFLPPQVPLFYSRPWGGEQLVHPLYLFIIPLANLLVLILNSVLISFIPKKDSLIRQILTIGVLIFNSLSLITLIQIIRLVI